MGVAVVAAGELWLKAERSVINLSGLTPLANTGTYLPACTMLLLVHYTPGSQCKN